MPALSFNKKFIAAVESGRKQQTIRRFRKHPIKFGDTLYLYTAQRTKYCRKLGEAKCIGSGIITIRKNSITIKHMLNIKLTDEKELDHLSRLDGFKNWEDMRSWWIKTHGLPFTGSIIYWNHFRKEATNA